MIGFVSVIGMLLIIFLLNQVDGPYRYHPTPIPSTSLSTTPGIAESTQHAAIAGAIGGYIVWGKYSSINYQIVLYLTSRILTGLVSLAREKLVPPFSWKMLHFHNVYPIQAAVVWGTVMALFETYPHVLHPSLKKSMDEVYRNS
jgi:peroxisomal membrane protein 4